MRSNKDKASVVFELKNGRRKEPLRQQQVVNAVGGQLALNRQILAQQLAAAVDPLALAALAESRAAAASSGGASGGANGLVPFFGGGAVGYQPVIIWLPEGAMMGVTAVVSADRRYVRITPMPIFLRRVAGQHLQYGHRRQVARHRVARGNSGYSGASQRRRPQAPQVRRRSLLVQRQSSCRLCRLVSFSLWERSRVRADGHRKPDISWRRPPDPRARPIGQAPRAYFFP